MANSFLFVRVRPVSENRGSLTVEAAVILPVFLSVFLLFLFLLKAASIQITLDQAVRATAGEIAAYAYPLALLNEYEDEKERESSPETAAKKSEPDVIRWDTISPLPAEDLMRRLVSGQINADYNLLYYMFKDWGKYAVVKTILGKYLDQSAVNTDNIIFRLIELPQSGTEYENKEGSEACRQSGLIRGEDFGKDDVVLSVDYHLKIPLPFFKNFPGVISVQAVEKAWLAGGNGIYTDRTEKSIFKDEGTVVYITRTGQKYHRGNCRYLRKSRIPVYLDYARVGYEPCKVCKPSELD